MHAAGSLAGGTVSSLSKPTNVMGQGAGGALMGAAAGAGFGPIGMAAGAVIGGASSIIQARKAKQAEYEANKIASRVRRQNLSSNARAVANEFSTDNIKMSGYSFAKGGYLKKSYKKGGYLVEDGELLYSGEAPQTNSQGRADEIAPNTYKFKGDSHSDHSGGIGVTGGKDPFVDSGSNLVKSGFVLSNKLRTDPKPFLNLKKRYS